MNDYKSAGAGGCGRFFLCQRAVNDHEIYASASAAAVTRLWLCCCTHWNLSICAADTGHSICRTELQ